MSSTYSRVLRSPGGVWLLGVGTLARLGRGMKPLGRGRRQPDLVRWPGRRLARAERDASPTA